MVEQKELDLRIPLRLQDYLHLQFWCLQRLYIYILLAIPIILFGFALWMITQRGYGIDDAVYELYEQSFPDILWPVVGGAIGASICFPLVAVKWVQKKLSRELHVSISADEVIVFGKDITHTTKWPNITSLTESSRAYLLKVKQPLVRLPKRGFTQEQRFLFESLARTGMSAKAYKLSPK